MTHVSTYLISMDVCVCVVGINNYKHTQLTFAVTVADLNKLSHLPHTPE